MESGDGPGEFKFHPNAAANFDEAVKDILRAVQAFPSLPPRTNTAEIYAGFHLDEADIIGTPIVQQTSVDVFGQQVGFFWTSKGLRVGWEGEQYQKIKQLVAKIERATKGRVSNEFLMNHTLSWLQSILELNRTDGFADYIQEQCVNEIKEHEIWIPIYRTYSAQNFALGNVEFRTVTKEMLDKWSSKLSPGAEPNSPVALANDRDRSSIQSSLAACVTVEAEVEKAREIAHKTANDAVGLLRFISPINLQHKFVSYAVPVGRENTQKTVEYFLEQGEIRRQKQSWIDRGPDSWNVDDARNMCPGVFENLQRLCLNPNESEFRRILHRSLLLHAQNTISAEIAQKLVYVTSAIESLLLINSTEPIQKNLGERMAFIVGRDLAQRRAIVQNVDKFYSIRSRLFHHGEEVNPDDVAVIDQFFCNVWATFAELLGKLDLFQSKDNLIRDLEDKKLS